jgi:Na+/H+-dicarboxylate symporter
MKKLIAKIKSDLSWQIFLAMLLAIIVGFALKFLPEEINQHLLAVFDTGGRLFLNLMKMIVVPIVFVSLTAGISSISQSSQLSFNKGGSLGRVGGKALIYFLITTVFAVSLAVFLGDVTQVGSGASFALAKTSEVTSQFSLQEMFVNLIPSNPIKALSEGNILQIIFFAVVLGLAINLSGEKGKRLADFFQDASSVVMKMVMLLMKLAPYGVFCLIIVVFEQFGVGMFEQLLGYFLLAIAGLLLFPIFIYSALLKFVAHLSPLKFFRKMYASLLFAFSTASSNATMPLVFDALENKVGISNKIVSLIIPLGINMNKNGSAFVEGLAAIFIANVYHIHLTLVTKLIIILTTTLAAIGTAGTPSAGLFVLVMVLKQAGLPTEGVALVIGIDRFLDMLRTSINVAGNAMIACLIGKSEKELDQKVFEE